MYEQAAMPILSSESFEAVRSAIVNSFSAPRVGEFLKTLERHSLRIRSFEDVLGKGVLGASVASEYARLPAGDQGQIRELYLAELERVAPELRNRYFKLYAYY